MHPDIQRGDDADRNVSLRILEFFGGRGNGIEANVSKKDDGAAGENSRPSIGSKRMPVGGMNEARCESDEDKDRDNFQQDHHIVGFGRLADSPNEDHRKQHYYDERGPIEAKMPAWGIEHISLQIGEAVRKIGGRDPGESWVDANPGEKSNHVRGKPYTDGHVADRVFQNQGPADDPRDQLAQSGI